MVLHRCLSGALRRQSDFTSSRVQLCPCPRILMCVPGWEASELMTVLTVPVIHPVYLSHTCPFMCPDTSRRLFWLFCSLLGQNTS